MTTASLAIGGHKTTAKVLKPTPCTQASSRLMASGKSTICTVHPKERRATQTRKPMLVDMQLYTAIWEQLRRWPKLQVLLQIQPWYNTQQQCLSMMAALYLSNKHT
jgi:hypothetical protein